MSHFVEEFLGQHDIKFGVQYTKGRGNWQGGYFQNYVNFLYPFRWTQSVDNMQAWYGDTGLLVYNNKDTLNPFLTVRTADSTGLFFDDQLLDDDPPFQRGVSLIVMIVVPASTRQIQRARGSVFAGRQQPDLIHWRALIVRIDGIGDHRVRLRVTVDELHPAPGLDANFRGGDA